MLIIEYVSKKEFQANGAKFNLTGLYKLPRQTCQTTFVHYFYSFIPFLSSRVQRTERQTETTYSFHSNVYFLTVDMRVIRTRVPGHKISPRRSPSRVEPSVYFFLLILLSVMSDHYGRWGVAHKLLRKKKENN